MSISAASPVTSSAIESEAEADSCPTNPMLSAPPPPRPSPMADVWDAAEPTADDDFDFHDTIPAPPWLDDALDPGDPTAD